MVKAKITETIKRKVTIKHSAETAALYQLAGVKGKILLEKFPQYSKATIYRHAVRPISEEEPFDRRRLNKGRPPKLTELDKRRILRAIPRLRRTEGSFISPRIAMTVGVEQRVSNRTVRRVIKKSGFMYLQMQKKGLLLPKDLPIRRKFCGKIVRRKLQEKFLKHCMPPIVYDSTVQ